MDIHKSLVQVFGSQRGKGGAGKKSSPAWPFVNHYWKQVHSAKLQETTPLSGDQLVHSLCPLRRFP
eukprot:9498654-Karenia_brevis.AAC.1